MHKMMKELPVETGHEDEFFICDFLVIKNNRWTHILTSSKPLEKDVYYAMTSPCKKETGFFLKAIPVSETVFSGARRILPNEKS